MRRLDLRRISLTRDPDLPFPGDACPECGGKIVIYAVKRDDEARRVTRYLECQDCGHKPPGNKWVAQE